MGDRFDSTLVHINESRFLMLGSLLPSFLIMESLEFVQLTSYSCVYSRPDCMPSANFRSMNDASFQLGDEPFLLRKIFSSDYNDVL